MTERSLILYIRSCKKAIGIEDTGSWGYIGAPGIRGGMRLIKDYKVQTSTRYEYALANEQQNAVNMVESLADEYSFKLRIVDVTKQSTAKRLIERELRQINVFPTLIFDTGERFEGTIGKDSLRAIMSKNRSNKFL